MASTRKKTKDSPSPASFTARVSPRAKARLDALAFLTQESVQALMEKAFWTYWDSLTPADRDSAEGIAQAREKREKSG